MNISSNGFNSIELMRDQLLKKENKRIPEQTTEANSFESILQEKQQVKEASELKFSKHASDRLVSRNIDLTSDQLGKLEAGTMKARMKGIQESLVVVDGLSFIVNVKNNTVITAIEEQQEQVFTNIDGAVIM